MHWKTEWLTMHSFCMATFECITRNKIDGTGIFYPELLIGGMGISFIYIKGLSWWNRQNDSEERTNAILPLTWGGRHCELRAHNEWISLLWSPNGPPNTTTVWFRICTIQFDRVVLNCGMPFTVSPSKQNQFSEKTVIIGGIPPSQSSYDEAWWLAIALSPTTCCYQTILITQAWGDQFQ